MCLHRYVADILKRFAMDQSKQNVISPVDMRTKMVSSAKAYKVKAPFRKAVSALMHLMTAAWPDMVFAVTCAARIMENPQESTGLQ